MFQKNRFLFVLLFAVQSLFAQIPQGFNYQATVRNQTGELLTNEYVGIRFHIVQGTEQNNPVYSEFHYESTDDLGSLHLMIGQGTVEAGAFNQIDWSLGDYHMGIEINTGDGFIDMGTTQLMSVPFALYALNSGTTNSASLPQGTNDGDVLRWNSATNSWTVEDVSVNLSPVYLAENGITVKAKDWAGIGAKGMLNGVEYTVVDSGMLREMDEYDSDRVKDLTTVCTSRITNMENLFSSFENFNQDISAWDVRNVTNMSSMFPGARNFNQDLSAWDVSNVTDMNYMFENATSFNQDLSAWDVSNVTNMSRMFSNASSFNQDLSSWDVSNVTNMEYMFYNAQNFNQDLSAWDVGNVTSMSGMFENAQNFNQDLSAWDVNNVLGFNDFDAETPSWTLPKPNFISPFYLDANGITVKAKEGTPIGAKGLLNGVEYTVVHSYMLSNRIRNGEDVTKVCTSRVEYMDGGMFHEHFNQDLSSWDVSNVTSMQYMFSGAHDFNQDLSAWDVSNVTNMEYMFLYAYNFNQDLSAWDVSNVTTMNGMFYEATSFNQDLSSWDVSNVQEYWDFDADTPQWTLPKPNFKITNVSFTSTASGDGTKITITPTSNSIEGTSYSIDFNDPAAAEGADIIETLGGGVTYDYPNEDATYTITVTASNGMESETYSADLMVTFRELLIGSWSIAAEAGALGVGPAQGDLSWWSNSEEDVATRACLMDDEFVFGADGSFANVMGESTWLLGFQGADEGCGAPVYPHDGSATHYTYDYDADAGTITLNGVGAHLGISRVYNGGELTSPSEAAGIESITYTIVEMEAARMTVEIQIFDGGFWTYVLTKN